ncbi:hypothetical protein HYN48_13930 [Flavobacterium magnum]|uniref:Uncharacterized protein n=1 Tax=Flavobacterium magnum TaxID=2162713 RepID=A0A2S0RIQ4_9FLAO|nr:hypothetical protein [Flavobacterium magnum]AWA31098.1 hypothetical protein HYN48_13930 [Flavobacterium magnum]
MEIGKQFNSLRFEDYFFYIDNYKKYSDFNTLGLYRSLSENEKLNLEQKISIRDYANKIFEKTFNFLQVKDPWTYIKVQTLGLELTDGDKEEMWRKIFINQEKILREKRIKHKNFGEYSKHNCGYETCPMNGIMIKQGSFMAEYEMCIGNINRYVQKQKSEKRKSDRKSESQIINNELDLE